MISTMRRCRPNVPDFYSETSGSTSRPFPCTEFFISFHCFNCQAKDRWSSPPAPLKMLSKKSPRRGLKPKIDILEHTNGGSCQLRHINVLQFFLAKHFLQFESTSTNGPTRIMPMRASPPGSCSERCSSPSPRWSAMLSGSKLSVSVLHSLCFIISGEAAFWSPNCDPLRSVTLY